MAIKNKIGLAMCGLVLASFGLATNVSAVQFDDKGLSEDGKFHVKMVPPSNMSEQYALNEAISDLTGGDWGITSMGQWNCKDGFTACKLVYHGTELTDEYYEIVYEYDPVAKQRIDKILKDFSVPEDGFFVTDAELLKYWAFGGDNLSAVSSKVKMALENVNLDFTIDVRGGGDEPLMTHNIGEAKVFYDDTLYAIVNNPSGPTKVVAPHIFYVETGSSDLAKALMDRIVAIYGEDARKAVGIATTGKKVSDYIASDDMFYDLFKDNLNANVFEMNIGDGNMGESHLIAIVADSSRVETFAGVDSTDLLTNINIKTAADNLPGDAATKAENLGSDDEEIKEDFKGKFNIYEIGLYSASTKSDITDGDDEKFVVSIPIPENLKGMDMISAYWKDSETGELEEHPARLVNGVAVFETTHFSTYVLAEGTVKPEEPEAEGEDDVVVPGVPDTGANANSLESMAVSLPLFGAIIVVTGVVAFILTKRG